MNTFVNFSNHPSCRWSDLQIREAKKFGLIVDLPYPTVNPGFGEQEIAELSDEYVEKILAYNPSAVLCQGEFTLCYGVVSRLKSLGVAVMAACSERDVIETEEGKITKFKFVRFREY